MKHVLLLFFSLFWFSINAQHFTIETTELINKKDTCVTVKRMYVEVSFNKRSGLLTLIYKNKTNIHRVSSFKKTNKNTYVIRYNGITYYLSKKQLIIVADLVIENEVYKIIKKFNN